MVEKFEHVLVTGAAGFIGFHLSARLLRHGCRVIGIDNLTPYYDVELKKARLEQLLGNPAFSFERVDLADRRDLEDLFNGNGFDAVVNLAAQAGVRYSLEVPEAYVNSNLVGFANILECCRHHRIKHLVYASSSSVYGANTMMPFSVHHNVDHPVSLYAATKKSNELMAHTYSHLFRLPCTGLRFFTVYGPWGRPDMALFIFTRAILDGKPIKVYNHGKMRRDFTYIDDIVEGVFRVLHRPAQSNSRWNGNHPDPGTSNAPYRIYNIGNNQPVELTEFIAILESVLGTKAKKEFCDLQPGDVVATCADVDDLMQDVGFRPNTPLETGIQAFVKWFREYYGR
ncbi:MAG: NAD-dependent epimerase [Desulfobacterales bacterium]|nr:NAD-dependent epimerase [Desulfobacterales bacterium]MDD3081066.1 NAD-dependent epimerase [Desulfobacterales bacterium]MDD3950533.1 NAD-dependent epimerase [Desulfobacterales bacterium]MDD4464158.1 NAD-dependent epimerase [Desulfobacterales bacterium]